MAQPKPSKHPNDKIEVEPGADKRLANILKRALNTPPNHKPSASKEQSARGKRRPSRNRTHTPPNGITINVAVIVAANCKSENRGKKLSAIATTINRPEVTTDHAQPMTHHRIKRSITAMTC